LLRSDSGTLCSISSSLTSTLSPTRRPSVVVYGQIKDQNVR
jgi:hypothetical protein